MASMIVDADADAGRRSESDADVEDDDRDIAPPGDEPEPDAQPDRQPDAGRRISTNPSSTDFFIFFIFFLVFGFVLLGFAELNFFLGST